MGGGDEEEDAVAAAVASAAAAVGAVVAAAAAPEKLNKFALISLYFDMMLDDGVYDAGIRRNPMCSKEFLGDCFAAPETYEQH